MEPDPDLLGLRILVADDEILIGLDVAFVFLAAGAEVVGPYTSLAEALAAAEKEALAAAVLDIRLGRQNSVAVAETLACRNIPFLFYSGQALPGEVSHAVRDATVLPKPAEPAALVNAIKDLVEPRRPQ